MNTADKAAWVAQRVAEARADVAAGRNRPSCHCTGHCGGDRETCPALNREPYSVAELVELSAFIAEAGGDAELAAMFRAVRPAR